MKEKTAFQKFQSDISHPAFLLVFFALGFTGIYYSRALVSIFGVGMLGIGLVSHIGRGDWKQALWNRHTIPFILLFAVYLLSALLSEDVSNGFSRLKTNNYFVTIALGISLLQPFRKSFINNTLLVYAAVSTISAILVTISYFFNFADYSEAYKVGKTIETPIIHIQYSFYISLAALIAGNLWLERTWADYRRYLAGGIFIFLFLFLHMLAVRTGLVSLYGGIGLFALIKGRNYIKPVYIAAISGLVILGLVLAVNYVPSLKNKWQYTRHDLKMFMEGKGGHQYSDNLRLNSIDNGFKLLGQYPMLGTGIGDLDADSRAMYNAYYPDTPEPLQSPPISQYFYSLTAFGLVGGFLFFVFLLYPLTYKGQWNDNLLLLVYGASLGSFIGDYSIELQLGKVVFVTLISLTLWRITADGQHQEFESL